jgi:hypothetical protein
MYGQPSLGFGGNPQLTQIDNLQRAALTPYQGTAAGGGAAQGAAQLAAALLARQRMQQYKQRLGIPQYGVPGQQPGSVMNSPTPALGAGAQTPGLAGFMAGNQAPGADA